MRIKSETFINPNAIAQVGGENFTANTVSSSFETALKNISEAGGARGCEINPAITQLAQQVADGTIAQPEAINSFVELIVKDGPNAHLYGSLNQDIHQAIGAIVTHDTQLSSRIFQALMALGSQENK